MTQGEFFLVLAKVAGLCKSVGRIQDAWIIATANSQGLLIDESGPDAELNEILVPLIRFISGAQHDADAFEQVAHAHIAWEEYQQYLRHKDIRIRGAALAEQSRHHLR